MNAEEAAIAAAVVSLCLIPPATQARLESHRQDLKDYGWLPYEKSLSLQEALWGGGIKIVDAGSAEVSRFIDPALREWLRRTHLMNAVFPHIP